ncbi:hypothetical protein M0657_008208 [Pyricularia oryzae]|nr:hypothetical protein M9X92_008168 [Pyricularia oryzae]KAI7917230.1 hypothetical protein M0657_008208 [Pyricularia oryzae]
MVHLAHVVSTPMARLFKSASERCVCSKHETLPIKSQNRAVRNVGKQNSAGSGPLLEPINQSAMRGWDLNWLDN